MRYVILAILFLAVNLNVNGQNVQDSLLRALQNTSNTETKIRLYRNLADAAYETPQEINCLRMLYLSSLKSDNKEQLLWAVNDLAIAYTDKQMYDSAHYYVAMMKDIVDQKELSKWQAYPNMVIFNRQISEDTKALEKKLDELKEQSSKTNDIYSKIEHSFMLASGYDFMKKPKEALPYAEQAVSLCRTLPANEGTRYIVFTLPMLARAYMLVGMNEKAISLLEEAIKINENQYEQYYKNTRPFYPLSSFYIRQYTRLMMNVQFLTPEKANKYLQRIIVLCEQTTIPSNRYNCFLSLYNYYSNRNDYQKTIAINDSLISLAHDIAPYNVAGLYQLSSELYEMTGKPEEALKYLKMSILAKDSLETREMSNRISELQVEYEVNSLNYEKSQLEINNKRNVVILLSVVLALFLALCIYLYITLRQEKRMKAELKSLNNRAQESEQMKNAFINSICTEIQNPLNILIGFSDVMTDETLDYETRREFPREIRNNAAVLSRLINSMLEVSSLDVSTEKLPCEPTDLASICYQKMDYIMEQNKTGVECKIDMPAELYINTNARYLSLVVEHVLGNAIKFTDAGFIRLKCEMNKEKLTLSVTDTGCGIPADKQRVVFDRFVKLDPRKAGTGLGLYLCKLIIARLSGDIYIDSRYSGGTRIVIVLPLNGEE